MTLCPLCYPRVPPSSIPRSNPVYRLEQPLQSACTDERIQDVPKYCVHHPLISPLRTFAFPPVFHGRLACALRSCSTCSSLLFCNAHRPSSAAIISSYIKDVALPGLQRNMEREMMMNVRSKRWKRESGVKLNTKLVSLGRSWLVLNMELVELQVLQLASSFSHYQYILCPYGSHISETARFPPRNAFSYHDID